MQGQQYKETFSEVFPHLTSTGIEIYTRPLNFSPLFLIFPSGVFTVLKGKQEPVRLKGLPINAQQALGR